MLADFSTFDFFFSLPFSLSLSDLNGERSNKKIAKTNNSDFQVILNEDNLQQLTSKFDQARFIHLLSWKFIASACVSECLSEYIVHSTTYCVLAIQNSKNIVATILCVWNRKKKNLDFFYAVHLWISNKRPLCVCISPSIMFFNVVVVVRPSLKSLEWVQATVKLKNDASNLNIVFRWTTGLLCCCSC